MSKAWSWLVPADHPLLTINTVTFPSWEKWLEHWGSASHFEELFGLLHCGFAVPAVSNNVVGLSQTQEMNVQAQRIRFYLMIADGHASAEDSFMRIDEYSDGDLSEVHLNTARLRQQLARKAFGVVSQHLFKNANQEGRLPSWLWNAVHPEVLPQLIWFFRSNKRGQIQNLRYNGSRSSIHVEQADRFALELCKLGWTFNPRSSGHSSQAGQVLSRLEASRPHFIEILLGIGQIGLLEDADVYPLDKASWKKLEELALQPRPIRPANPAGVSETRTPRNMQEAWVNGSEAARVVILRGIAEAEERRFESSRAAVAK